MNKLIELLDQYDKYVDLVDYEKVQNFKAKLLKVENKKDFFNDKKLNDELCDFYQYCILVIERSALEDLELIDCYQNENNWIGELNKYIKELKKVFNEVFFN